MSVKSIAFRFFHIFLFLNSSFLGAINIFKFYLCTILIKHIFVSNLKMISCHIKTSTCKENTVDINQNTEHHNRFSRLSHLTAWAQHYSHCCVRTAVAPNCGYVLRNARWLSRAMPFHYWVSDLFLNAASPRLPQNRTWRLHPSRLYVMHCDTITQI